MKQVSQGWRWLSCYRRAYPERRLANRAGVGALVRSRVAADLVGWNWRMPCRGLQEMQGNRRMQNTSEQFQLRRVLSDCALERNAPACCFAALALLLGTLSAVVPEIISPIAAGALRPLQSPGTPL